MSSFSLEHTLSIIKPDAVRAGHTAAILNMMSVSDLSIVALYRTVLHEHEARAFYEEHKHRPFYDDLCSFMTSGPVVVSVLEGVNAIVRYRELMGATNPEEAASGTIRKIYAESIDHNAVHGSDSLTSAAREIAFFFAKKDLLNKVSEE